MKAEVVRRYLTLEWRKRFMWSGFFAGDVRKILCSFNSDFGVHGALGATIVLDNTLREKGTRLGLSLSL